MSDVQNFINQQLGFHTRRTYDSTLNRLRCTKGDEYKEILPNEDFDPDSLDTPIFACKFAQKEGYEHLLALANEDGRFAIHNTNTKERYGHQAHYNAIFDLAWMFQRMKIVTVSGDYTAKLFDVGNGEIRKEQIFIGHTRSVKTVTFRQNDFSVLATGGRDGSIIVWDTRTASNGNNLNHVYYGDSVTKTPDRTISNSHCMVKSTTPHGKSKKRQSNAGVGVSGANSVTGLVFQDDYTLISCGAGDGAIKLWDLRKSYKAYKKEPLPKHVIPYSGATTRNGFSNLLIDRSCLKLYANCLDNVIYCYNIGTCNPDPIMTYTGHQNSTFYVKSSLSGDGLYLISGSSDQNAYIWNVKDSMPLVKLVGHNAEVTCVAWRQKGDTTLVTCSDDMKHKIWRVGPEVVPDNWEVIGCGSAENLRSSSKIRLLDNKLKRLLEINETTPQSQKKRLKQCERCNSCVLIGTYCENCTSTKRKNPDPLNSESKRQQTDKGPRRLFSPIISNVQATTNVPEEELTKTPKASTKRDEILQSLTNSPLPNFAIDGCAPHLNYSPQKRNDKDWLTKLRVERSLMKEMQELAGPSPPKMPKLDLTPRSRNRNLAEQSGSPQSPLLKFFRVTSNPTKCDSQQCIVRSHGSAAVTPSSLPS